MEDRIVILLQDIQLGSGDAILKASSFINDEAFIVSLGDHMYDPHSFEEILAVYSKIDMESSRKNKIGLSAIKFCDESEIPYTGILKISNNIDNAINYDQQKIYLIEGMREKPVESVEDFKINQKSLYLSHLGIDILPSSVFDIIKDEKLMILKNNIDSEVCLRSAMKHLQEDHLLYGYLSQHDSSDFGTPNLYLRSLNKKINNHLHPTNPTNQQQKRSFCIYGGDREDNLKLLTWMKSNVTFNSKIGENLLDSNKCFKSNGTSIINIGSSPGRIDLMGGFSDYSGSQVLQYPISRRTYCFLVLSDEGNFKSFDLASIHVDSIENILNSKFTAANHKAEIWEASVSKDILFNNIEGNEFVDYTNLNNRLSNLHNSLNDIEITTSSKHPSNNWVSYVLGTIYECLNTSENITRLDLVKQIKEKSISIFLLSDIPPCSGLASSAALEMSILQAMDNAFNLNLIATEMPYLICQRVENKVIGAPTGFMDQRTVQEANADELISFRCCLPHSSFPANFIQIPENIEICAIETGIKRKVKNNSYENIQQASVMGKLILDELLGIDINCLADLSPVEYLKIDHFLPISLKGSQFIYKYNHILKLNTYPLTIKLDECYPIRAATRHPVMENNRVQMFQRGLHTNDNFFSSNNQVYRNLGKLMSQSHLSYSDLGLGHPDINILINILQKYMTNKNGNILYGAKITGGGNGGAVAVLTNKRTDYKSAINEACAEYLKVTNSPVCRLISGSSGNTKFHGSIRYFSSTLRGTFSQVTKPKILIVNHGYPPQFNGGSEIYTQTLATSLIQSGECESVEVFCREHDSYLPDFNLQSYEDPYENRLKIHSVNLSREAPYYRFKYNEVDEVFKTLLMILKPDIIHFGHLNHLSLNLPIIAKTLLSDVKCIYTLHDYWLMCPRGQFLFTGFTSPGEEPLQQCNSQNDVKCATRCFSSRYSTGSDAMFETDFNYWINWVKNRTESVKSTTNSIDCFIAPSKHLYNRFFNEYLMPIGQSHKLKLLPYGFDRKRLSGRTRLEELGNEGTKKYVFAYIGRHQPCKGVHLIIEAVISLLEKDPNLSKSIKIIIFGRSDSNSQHSLMRIINNSVLSKEENSHIIEFKPEYGNKVIVSTVFNHIDCVIVPSIW